MDSLKILSIESDKRVSLLVKDFSITVKRKRAKDIETAQAPAKILDNVSFDIKLGQLMAIMGGSGTGKTSLLNALAQKMNVSNRKLSFSGSIDYQQSSPGKKIRFSYLMPNDVFLPGLTLWDTLLFQADLKLPSHTNQTDKNELIMSLIHALDILHLKDEVVAQFGTGESHFSGGERRRVSLATQLLSSSQILFLDEPTTGLDTSSSLKLMKVLRRLASPDIGMTVIFSIYQPRREITELFDKICLLTNGGRQVYYGDLAGSSEYFSKFDFAKDSIQKLKNAFEYILSLSSKDSTSKYKEARTEARIDILVDAWRKSSNHVGCELNEKESFGHFKQNQELLGKDHNNKISFLRELTILTKRSFLLSYRDKASLISLNGLCLFFGFVCGWLFYRPGLGLSGIRSTTSSLYIILEVLGFCPMYIEIERLWSIDGLAFLREYNENSVSIPGFIISRKLGKFLLEDLPMSIIFAVITYFMFGLRIEGDAGYFFIYFSVTLLVICNGLSSGLLLFALAPNFAISSLLSNVYYVLQNCACGYFVDAGTMPVYVRWTKYIAHFWYAFGALVANQYTDWAGECPADDPDSPECVEYTGNYQLSILSFPGNWITVPVCILAVWFIGYNVIAGLVLKFKNLESAVAKTKKNNLGEEEDDDNCLNETDYKDDTEGLNQQKEMTYLNVNILDGSDEKFAREHLNLFFNDIELSVVSRDFWGKKQKKQLLKNVNTASTWNGVNAIMGPSGSGKTTFLNFIANRLPFKKESSGQISLNNCQPITPSQLARVAAYVTQHDDSLMPRLTVRETLYYQARLRLPIGEHSKIPLIVNSLLRKVELIDCADTLVGSEFVKGISNGNRRRLSIAIQLLSRPKVLFLDEPTSGLDSRSATSILELLNALSSEGRTIILTIHQPSESVFSLFESLLLFAKGGRLVYSGKANELRTYFNSIGMHVNEDVNIADFALDFMSPYVGEDEEACKSRVEGVVSRWRLGSVNEDKDEEREFIMPTDSRVSIDIMSHGKQRLPFRYNIRTIVGRLVVNSIRTRDSFIARTGQTVFIAAMCTLYFAPLKDTQTGINNRLGLIQNTMNLYFVGLVNNIALFPTERNIFYQDYKDGLYGVWELSVAYFVIELPVEIITSLIFSVLIVFGCGLPRESDMFFSIFAAGIVLTNCGESLGIIVNSIFNHLGLALNVLTSIVIVAIFMGGTMSINMPSFFYGINFVNPCKYAVGIGCRLGFAGETFECETDVCTFRTGMDVLENYNLDVNIGAYFGGLFACFILYRLLAIVILQLRVKYFN